MAKKKKSAGSLTTQDGAKRRVGRPSSFNLDIATEFCRRLSEGELAINICAEDGMPAMSTVYLWRENVPEFTEMHARARELQGHAAAEKAVQSGRAAKQDDAAAARVKFDADRWFAARLLPKTYGDRVAQEHTGPDGKPLPAPMTINVVRFGEGKE